LFLYLLLITALLGVVVAEAVTVLVIVVAAEVVLGVATEAQQHFPPH
jgi:hypothetical protein